MDAARRANAAPIHAQRIYASLGYRPGDRAASERTSKEALSLPMHPKLSADHMERVVDAIRSAL